MSVHFVGAGPGAPDLITLRGRDLLARADLVLYAGSLVPPAVLVHAPPDARLVDTRDLTLDRIVREIAAAHRTGGRVVRLHSGDLSIYSAAAEQMRRLDRIGIPYDVTPGVPAFAAAAAALGRELTVPGVAQTVVITRVSRRSTAMPAGERLAALAAHRATIVVHLAAREVGRVAAELLPACGPECPAAVVAHASQPEEAIVRARLADLERAARAAGIRRSAVIVVGPALGARGFPDSYLYSPRRERAERG